MQKTTREESAEKLKSLITQLHQGDERQLEIIYSQNNRIIVEAPAGHGKTKTMVSKLAYLLGTNKVPFPKRILALTFSVNAAYKIKKDVSENLPKMIQSLPQSPVSLNERIYISNYHGFARHMLGLYGYLIHEKLRIINKLKPLDDTKFDLILGQTGMSEDEAKLLMSFNEAVKRIDNKFLKANFSSYVNVVINKCLGAEKIPYNAILALAIHLLREQVQVKEFYSKYFHTIIVDEFQDTNVLSWSLLNKLICPDTSIILMGDPLQRIYGFIGAMPGLMSTAEKQLKMHPIRLEQNYRFRDNESMLLLDKNLRAHAQSPSAPQISSLSTIPFAHLQNQQEEALWLARRVAQLLDSPDNPTSRIAILVKQRNQNSDAILEGLRSEGVSHFFALFSDEEEDYISFHSSCALIFSQIIQNAPDRLTRRVLDRYFKAVEFAYKSDNSLRTQSLIKLLRVFLGRIIKDFDFLGSEDKVIFIRDTLENNALKQHMEFVEDRVIVSTIHGAKGLEWDYVFIPDMEQYSFPNWPSLCGNCSYKRGCDIKIDNNNESAFLQEIGLFYVGVTRAKRQVVLSASRNRIKKDGGEQYSNMSCLIRLQGISLVDFKDLERKIC